MITPAARYGLWTVLGVSPSVGKGPRLFVRCECGTERSVHTNSLRAGTSTNCGCVKRERMRQQKLGLKHGMSGTGTYRSWSAMLLRCQNPKSNSYRYYGARGVTVAPRWLKFENFLADMGVRPEGMTLDRWPNGKGNYEPGNCRWATAGEQSRNRDGFVLNVRHLGQTKTVAEWAREYGLGDTTLRYRLQNGWSMESALTTPADVYHGQLQGLPA